MAIITIEELFEQLSFGELNNQAVSVEGSGTIEKQQQNRIVSITNEALLRLHTRFPLIQEHVSLTLVPGQATEVELPDDVILMVSLLTTFGEALVPNNRKIADTLYLVNRRLHIPARLSELRRLHATYQKRHPVLQPITTPEDLEQEIHLLDVLLEALTAYIAQKIYSGMNSQEGIIIAAAHRQRYEQILYEAEAQGVVPSTNVSSNVFHARGFV